MIDILEKLTTTQTEQELENVLRDVKTFLFEGE